MSRTVKLCIAVTTLLVSLAAVFAQSGGAYELIGGIVGFEVQEVSGGGYELSGTVVTQPDTAAAPSGTMTANDYSLSGEFSASAETTARVPCPGDLLRPFGVGVEDLLALMDLWATTDLSADLDHNGHVGANDLLILLGNWGPCP